MPNNDIALSDYLSGGYYIAKYIERPSYFPKDLLPERIFSISKCISSFIPGTWAINWTVDEESERLERARYFGLSAEELKEITQWATDNFEVEFGAWCAFYSLYSAYNLRDRFLTGQNDLVIFGIGIHKSYFEVFTDAAKPPPQQPGYAPEGKTGVYTCVSKGKNIEPGGDVLGFELVNLEHGLIGCSWLCNGLERVFHDRLGIAPNKEGFIDTFESASECVDLISRGDINAEPGLWLPWLVVRYGQ